MQEALTQPTETIVTAKAREARCRNKNCGFVGDIDDYFGRRQWKGRSYVQSYCKVCRRTKKQVAPELLERLPVTQEVEAATQEDPGPTLKLPLPVDREALTGLYVQQFPGDKNGRKRAVLFMQQKLMKKLAKAAS